MSPHGPLPTPETVVYLLKRAIEKIGSRHQLAVRLGMSGEDVQRYLDGEANVPERVFLTCVDVLYESPAEVVKPAPKRPKGGK
jgi:hypothetical protein